MEVLRDSRGRQGYPLPEEGIYDENGFLFHHGYPRVILDVHRKRLAQHGIVIERKKSYSQQEVETLKRNWEAYRKDHSLSYWSIRKLCGLGASHSERRSRKGEREKIRNFLQETNFWPRFCAGIDRRTSYLIRRSVNTIFDKHYDTPVRVDERAYCLSLYLSTRSWLAVATIMKRSLRSVAACIKLASYRKTFSRSERRWLWMTVRNEHAALFKDVDLPSASLINWKLMELRCLRNADTLARQWEEMIEELKAELEAGHTLDEALDIVAPKCQRVTPLQVAQFIYIIKDKVVDNEDQRIGRAEAFVAPLMREQGLTGFHSRRLSEFNYLRSLVNKIIINCRDRMLNPCRMVVSLRHLLKLIAEILRTLSDSDTPRKIRITTKHFFSTLIRLQREHDSTWTPRNKRLRKFIAKILPELS